MTRAELEALAAATCRDLDGYCNEHDLAAQYFMKGFLAAIPYAFEAARATKHEDELEKVTLSNGMVATVEDGANYRYETPEDFCEGAEMSNDDCSELLNRMMRGLRDSLDKGTKSEQQRERELSLEPERIYSSGGAAGLTEEWKKFDDGTECRVIKGVYESRPWRREQEKGK